MLLLLLLLLSPFTLLLTFLVLQLLWLPTLRGSGQQRAGSLFRLLLLWPLLLPSFLLYWMFLLLLMR